MQSKEASNNHGSFQLLASIGAILVSGLLLTACGGRVSLLPDVEDLYANSVSIDPSRTCAADDITAMKCARYLMNQLSHMEARAGHMDTGYAFASVAAGTLAAIYVKSDTDRTQALEDLAVSLGALTGLKSLLRTDDRRKLAQEGQRALQCMLDAADAVTTAADEARKRLDSGKRAAADARVARTTLNDARQALSNAKATYQRAQDAADGARQDRDRALAAVGTADEATKVLKQQAVSDAERRVEPANQELANASQEVEGAERAAREAALAEAASTRAANDMRWRQQGRVERFSAALRSDLGNAADKQAFQEFRKDGTAPWPAPVITDTYKLQLVGALEAQAKRVMAAQQESVEEAARAKTRIGRELGSGVYQVLARVRSGLAAPIKDLDGLAAVQRDTVNGLISKFAKAVKDEEEMEEELKSGVASAPDTNNAADVANEVTDPPDQAEEEAAKQQAVSEFQKCVIGDTA